ncbi:hypothetical protein QCA50_014924 [Cerrena zonata]|uniref:Uncharacterized protein n=1 Tax=Cerrena zonata TaxID=2478898 RepID=A0AAW0FAR5_9APHY
MSCALTPGGLYIALFLTSTPGRRRFHWALYHHYSHSEQIDKDGNLRTYNRGHKYHIRSLGEGWIADHTPESGIMTSAYIIGLVLIGHIDPDIAQNVSQVATRYDGSLNDMAGVTCRVWLKIILQDLLDANLLKLAGSVAQLEEEIYQFGEQGEQDAMNGILPPPIWTSELTL